VAGWHFDPPEQERHAFRYVHGWCVEFWVKPRYVGYPEQPESHRMAFFAEGKLRAIFSEGTRNAPLELDKWSPSWVDVTWRPAQPSPGR
jgi:hypothetical protein